MIPNRNYISPKHQRLHLPPLPAPLDRLPRTDRPSSITFKVGDYEIAVDRSVRSSRYVIVATVDGPSCPDEEVDQIRRIAAIHLLGSGNWLDCQIACGEEEVVPLIIDMIAQISPLEALSSAASPIQHATFVE